MLFEWALDGVALRAGVAQLAGLWIPSSSGNARWLLPSLRSILLRTVYTGTVSCFALRSEHRLTGDYSRRPGTADEVVVLPNIATAIITSDEQAAVAPFGTRDPLFPNPGFVTLRAYSL
jgi:hypothetical protein